MKELLDKSKVQKDKIRQYINKITADEMGKISEPCYFAPWKKDYFEILNAIGLKESDFKEFISTFYLERLSGDRILKDMGTNVVLFLLYYFLNQNDQQSYISTMLFLSIKFYSSICHKFFPKFCDRDLFRYTLDNLNKTHLFNREKTIANSLFYLTKEMIKKHTVIIKKFDDPERISLFVYELRNRIKQSVKSMAVLYYAYSEKGVKIKTSQEEDEGISKEQVLERGQRIIDETTRNITVYKQVDKKAISNSKKISRIDDSLSILIIETLMNTEFTEDIKLIYELYIKNLTNIKELCGSNFYTTVQNLMSIKRTIQPLFFKKQIYELLIKILGKTEHSKKLESMTAQTKLRYSQFLAYYLTLYIRNFLCS